jgi:hypothetical protein
MTQPMRDELAEHRNYVQRSGNNMAEIRDWKWRGRITQNGRRQPVAMSGRRAHDLRTISWSP